MEEEVFSIEKNATEEEVEGSEESEDFKKEINELYESNELRNLMSNNGLFKNKISNKIIFKELLKTTMIDINDEAIKRCKLNKNAEALVFLKRAEKTLEVRLVNSSNYSNFLVCCQLWQKYRQKRDNHNFIQHRLCLSKANLSFFKKN